MGRNLLGPTPHWGAVGTWWLPEMGEPLLGGVANGGCLYSSAWPLARTGRTKRTWQRRKREQDKLGSRLVWGEWKEESGGGCDVSTWYTCMKFSG